MEYYFLFAVCQQARPSTLADMAFYFSGLEFISTSTSPALKLATTKSDPL